VRQRLVFSSSSTPLYAATTVTVGADASKHVLKGTLVTPDDIFDGKFVIEGDTITCVAVDCDDPAGATLFSITPAYIFPGFNRRSQSCRLPKWTPPKRYQNRSQWQGSSSYKAFKAPYSDLKGQKGLFCEMVKYGEIKALIGGITTIQGTSPNKACFRTLIRNAENQNELGIPSSHIRTFILDITNFKGAVNWAVIKSFVVHLSEGVDEKSRKEFDVLKQKGLLTGQTAIIHGTAFGEAEFREMGAVGAKLIWSPQSNFLLYGRTTDIKTAREQGVSVSLGVDWNPTGSDNIFDEPRVAAQASEEAFDGVIPDAEWIRMITANPAKALALDDRIGKLAPGMKADITVLKAKDPDPHQSLLNTFLADVEMVWVGGDLLYANKTIPQTVRPGACEPLKVYGADKRICVKDTNGPVEKSGQTLEEIQMILKTNYPNLAPLAP
jgi:hypothetical protein